MISLWQHLYSVSAAVFKFQDVLSASLFANRIVHKFIILPYDDIFTECEFEFRQEFPPLAF